MGIWNHYVIIENRSVSLEEMEAALRQVNPDFSIDGDVIMLPDEKFGELEYGQTSITNFNKAPLLPDRSYFKELAEEKQNKDRLLFVLKHAKSMVTIQLLNSGIWWKKEYHKTLAPLQNWLIQNREGVLIVDEGDFYDQLDLIK